VLGRAIARLLPAVPRPVVRRLSARYIAGSELADAVRVVRALNAGGKAATLDVLGVEVRRREQAAAVLTEYLGALEAIERERLDANVSVKPTAIGLRLGGDAARGHLETLVRAAAGRGSFVRLDMEDSSTTSSTLALYRELRAEGLDNVGVVLQAELLRTLDDVDDLAGLRPNVRVCKGIYAEPASVAYQGAAAVRENFVRAVEMLLDAGAYVAVATHDEWLVDSCRRIVEERGLGPEAYELQLLLGVKPELADALVREGCRVRIYVPYGRRWYEYSLRRLQENPLVAGYVASDLLRRVVLRSGRRA
jgi:proline dehydrogenase